MHRIGPLTVLALILAWCGAWAAPIGYGARATGGTTPCIASSAAELRTCLETGGQLVTVPAPLTVDPLETPLHVAQNTTLDGKGVLTVAASQYGLWIKGSNVVIRNVTFRGPGPAGTLKPAAHPRADCVNGIYGWQYLGCGVQIYIPGAVSDVWIDHNDFAVCGNKCVAGYDNNDGLGRPDQITLSYNIFRRSFLPVNFAVSPLMASTPAPGHVTVYGNLWDTNYERQPQAAGGYQMHVFNNYYAGPCLRAAGPGQGPDVTGGGEMLLENNVADPGACGGAVGKSAFNPTTRNGGVGGYARPPGAVRTRGNIGMSPQYADALGFSPTYPYRLLPADQVKADVLAHAGVSR